MAIPEDERHNYQPEENSQSTRGNMDHSLKLPQRHGEIPLGSMLRVIRNPNLFLFDLPQQSNAEQFIRGVAETSSHKLHSFRGIPKSPKGRKMFKHSITR